MRTSSEYFTQLSRTTKPTLRVTIEIPIAILYLLYGLVIWPFCTLHTAAHDRTRFAKHRLGISKLLRRCRSEHWRKCHPIPPPALLPVYISKRNALSTTDLTSPIRSHLLSLPTELRILIYRHVLGNRRLRITRHTCSTSGVESLRHVLVVLPRPPCPYHTHCGCIRHVPCPDLLPLLLTSKIVYREAVEVLYSQNVFKFCDVEDFCDWLHGILPVRRRAVRKVMLHWPMRTWEILWDHRHDSHYWAKWRYVRGCVRRVIPVRTWTAKETQEGWSSTWEAVRLLGLEMDRQRLKLGVYVSLSQAVVGARREGVFGRGYWLEPLAGIEGGVKDVRVWVWENVEYYSPDAVRRSKTECAAMGGAVAEFIRNGKGIGEPWVYVEENLERSEDRLGIWFIPGVFGP